MNKVFQKVPKSAIILMPPEGSWAPIQEIRKVHDSAYKRWMPHINLVYPFVISEHFEEVIEDLKNALRIISPFEITLQEFDYFKHSKKCALWLKPETSEDKPIHRLVKVLEGVFPYCSDLSNISEAGYTPHLSVGQFQKNEVNEMKNAFQNQWQQINWKVNEIFVISREGFEDPFQINYKISLGENNEIIAVNPVAKRNEKTTQLKLFIGGIPTDVTLNELNDCLQSNGIYTEKINLIQNRENPSKNKGFAFAYFTSSEEKEKAKQLSKKITLIGRNLTFSESK